MAVFADSQNVTINGGNFNAIIQPSRSEAPKVLVDHVAVGALHNSRELSNLLKCHHNTCAAVLTEMQAWIDDTESPYYTMWMHGPAGAGKSSIAQKFAQMCHERRQLAASFFFSGLGASELRDEQRLIGTIVYQLYQNMPAIRLLIQSILGNDPHVFGLSLEAQVEKLIVEPLAHLSHLADTQSRAMLIVIDGLDECQNVHGAQENIITTFVSAISRIQHNYPHKLLIVSRPERHIKTTLNTHGPFQTLPLNDPKWGTFDDFRIPSVDISCKIPEPPLVKQFPTSLTTSRQHFRGSRPKLILAFDVGTTYCGISYSVLCPGQVPEIKAITRYPAHEDIGNALKIPSIIYYDRNGEVKAVGAEAMREGIYETAEDEQWVKVEWFKLHMRTRVGASEEMNPDIPPLPPTKTVVEVLADFLAYLFKCAAKYILETRANGAEHWDSVKGQIEFVLCHPNGWEGAQRNEMRRAATLAKLVPDTPAGHARLSFVTVGEANLHFAMHNGLPAGVMKNGDGVVIVDAGGGTIDISSYSKSQHGEKEAFEEIAAPQCHLRGSVFVNIRARRFLENYLAESTFANDIENIVLCFDKTTKLKFRNAEELQYIKFGSTRDNDQYYKITSGQLKLPGVYVATFFEPSIQCIIEAVTNQLTTAHRPISHVVLVGGFSASSWIFSKVRAALSPFGLNIIRPESHINKAVSDGAISFYLDHLVSTRVSKFTYRNFCNISFDPKNTDHYDRREKIFISLSGEKLISNAFAVILPKNTQVSEIQEFKTPYFRESESKEDFKAVLSHIWCYSGAVLNPKWKDVDTQNYTKLCTIEADLSHLPLSLQRKPNGGTFFRVDYEIVLLFGLPEIQAQVVWKDNGKENW